MKRLIGIVVLLFFAPASVMAASVVDAVKDYQDGKEAKKKFKKKIAPLGRKLFMTSEKFKNLYHRHLQIMAYTYAGKGYSGTATANASQEQSALKKAGDFSHKIAGNIGGTLKKQFKLFKLSNSLKTSTSSQNAMQNPQGIIQSYQSSAQSATNRIGGLAKNASNVAQDEDAPSGENSQQSQQQVQGSQSYLQGQASGISKQLGSYNSKLNSGYFKQMANQKNITEMQAAAQGAMKNMQNVQKQVQSAMQTARAMQQIQFGWLEDIRKDAIKNIKQQTTELATILGFGRSIKPQLYKITELMMQRSAMRAVEAPESHKRTKKLLKVKGSMTMNQSGNEQGQSPAEDNNQQSGYDKSSAPKSLGKLTPTYSGPIEDDVLNAMKTKGVKSSVVSTVRDRIVGTLRSVPPEKRSELAVSITGRTSKAVDELDDPKKAYKVFNAVDAAQGEAGS